MTNIINKFGFIKVKIDLNSNDIKFQDIDDNDIADELTELEKKAFLSGAERIVTDGTAHFYKKEQDYVFLNENRHEREIFYYDTYGWNFK